MCDVCDMHCLFINENVSYCILIAHQHMCRTILVRAGGMLDP